MKKALLLIVVGMMALAAGTANAVTLHFDPSTTVVGVGSTYNVSILADIGQSEGIVGWGLDLNYDSSLLKLNSITVGSLWDQMLPPASDDGLAGLLIPTPTSPPDGVTGNNTLLAVLNFTCLGLGTSPLQLSFTDGDLTEGLMTATGDFANITYVDGLVDQAASTVPEPSTLLLLIVGLCGLPVYMRIRTKASASA